MNEGKDGQKNTCYFPVEISLDSCTQIKFISRNVNWTRVKPLRKCLNGIPLPEHPILSLRFSVWPKCRSCNSSIIPSSIKLAKQAWRHAHVTWHYGRKLRVFPIAALRGWGGGRGRGRGCKTCFHAVAAMTPPATLTIWCAFSTLSQLSHTKFNT